MPWTPVSGCAVCIFSAYVETLRFYVTAAGCDILSSSCMVGMLSGYKMTNGKPDLFWDFQWKMDIDSASLRSQRGCVAFWVYYVRELHVTHHGFCLNYGCTSIWLRPSFAFLFKSLIP